MSAQFLGRLLLVSSAVGSVLAVVAPVRRDGSSPGLKSDPNTTKYCSWWIDYNTATPCSQVLSDNSITLTEFRRWNPSISASCDNLAVGRSYCVEVSGEPITTTSSSRPTTTSTPTSKAVTTTTKPPNGITTPTPTQPDIVDNCDEFYYVKSGDTCENIAATHGISAAQFLQWNPKSGSKCEGLWANAYACVSIIGHTPPPTTTSSKPSNGVTTPTPTQSGMVSNCNKFHYVEDSQNCQTIASKYGISVSQFTTWNPAAKSDCTGLWSKTYACVGLIGSSPPPTTTTKGNGVTTPTPTQDGMTKNCKTFYYVKSGDSCASIASSYKITTGQFYSWNPATGSDCRSLWANTWACVAVL